MNANKEPIRVQNESGVTSLHKTAIVEQAYIAMMLFDAMRADKKSINMQNEDSETSLCLGV
jgi:hypothetical protein